MHMFRLVLIAMLSVSLAAPTTAQTAALTTTARDRRAVNVTVYNSDLGLIRETRTLNIPAGRNLLRFADVASLIRPETVYLGSLNAPAALRILEQNYQYDLLNPAKLLDKFVGRELTLVLRRYQNDAEILEPVTATLLANNNGQVWRINNQIVINPTNIAETRFPDLPQNLVASPTLVLDLENRQAGQHTVEASYLTGGMTWRADYVLVVNTDDTRGDMQGWVTLQNTSGTGFENARLQLVAGDVNRVRDQVQVFRRERGEIAQSAPPAPPQFQEQSFFEYHLYTLERPATVRDQETKQISLLEAADFAVTREYVVNGQQHYFRGYNAPGQPVREQVGVFVEFRNTKDNKLGMPLPAGTVRLYKRDASGNNQFIGEDRIAHTPRNEPVRVRVGDAFDVVAERKQTDYRVIARNLYEYAYEISLRNRKETPITVIVNEPVGGDWEVVTSSHTPEKTAAFAARFRVPVAADGETKLTYRVRVKY